MPAHVGIGPDPKLAARVRDADLLLVVGARLDDATTGGYTLVPPGPPSGALVHVQPDAAELGRVYQPTLAIVSGSPEFAAAARSARAGRPVGLAERDRSRLAPTSSRASSTSPARATSRWAR